jgi:hypothetical protein
MGERKMIKTSLFKIGVVVLLLLATVLPVSGDIQRSRHTAEKTSSKEQIQNRTPYYEIPHYIGIRCDKIYIYDDSERDSHSPGEFSFKLFSFPRMWHWTTITYELDVSPTPYDLGRLGGMEEVHFTPQLIIIIAIELDEGIQNPNDLLDWMIIRWNPPKDDYEWPNQIQEIYTWENNFFKAVIKVYMHYGAPGA